ncbi:MAG: DUF5522 domain-containing protein, partial [Pseudomonadota bacterium]
MKNVKHLEPREGEDFYLENEFMVFTAKWHLKRGYCCGSGCRHCPYDNTPKASKSKATDASPSVEAKKKCLVSRICGSIQELVVFQA